MTVRPFPHWNSNCKPSNDMLKPVFARGDYIVLGNQFIVALDGVVRVANFSRPPKQDGTWYDGHWDGTIPDRWMQFPRPEKIDGVWHWVELCDNCMPF